MSGALDVLQMKEEVLKFPAAGTQCGGTNFDFQTEQFIYQRKKDDAHVTNLKGTGRSFHGQLGPGCPGKPG